MFPRRPWEQEQTGRVKAYAQDKDGNLTELLVDEVIPDFQHKKAAIEQVLPTK